MGEAKRRGTYEERKALAIARKNHIQSEADRLFKEWKKKRDRTITIEDGEVVEDSQ